VVLFVALVKINNAAPPRATVMFPFNAMLIIGAQWFVWGRIPTHKAVVLK
jgi:hypothetical protein